METKPAVDPEETAEISVMDVAAAEEHQAKDDLSEEHASAGKNDPAA